jgi:hypothetical protein
MEEEKALLEYRTSSHMIHLPPKQIKLRRLEAKL